jgi:hypothetical protein
LANRSAAHYSLGKLEDALSDAEQCIVLQPTLHKGFLRKGLALAGLCDFQGAVEALKTAHELCPEDEAVVAALKEAEADAASLVAGGEVSRYKREEDGRKTSKFVTHRAAAELEEEMDAQFARTQQKLRAVASRTVEQSVHMTNEMLFEEIRHAKAEDQHKEDTERAKFQAVRQGVDYDQFEQNVKGASLKATRTKGPGTNSGPGVLLHGGSGNAVPGLAKKVLNKEAGDGGHHQWLPRDNSEAEQQELSAAVSRLFSARAPAEQDALRLYLSNSKEFVRRWRALGTGKAEDRYLLLRAVAPAQLAGIFKTEMEAEVMTEIAENFALVLPRVATVVAAGVCVGGGGESTDVTVEEKAAARHAVQLLDAISRLKRFELNTKFLSKKEKGHVAAVLDWCIKAEAALQELAERVRVSFAL